MLSLVRPTVWSEVIGQDSITKDLQSRLLNTKTFPQAILLTGPTGTGKTSCATLIARTIVCEKPVNGNPCNQCSMCKRTASESWDTTDIIMLDSAKLLKTDLVELDDLVSYSPHFSDRKVILIEEVQELSAKYQNTFLKLLESNLPHVVFVFTTMDFGKITKAIYTRCQRYAFKTPSHSDIAKFLFGQLPEKLLNNPQFVGETIFLLAEAAENSYRGALQVLDRAISSDITTPEQVKEEFALITDASIQEYMKSVLDGCADHIPAIRKESPGFFFKSMHFLCRVKQAQLTGSFNDDSQGMMSFFSKHPNVDKLLTLYRTVLERGYSDDVFMLSLYEFVTQIKAASAVPAGVRPQVRPTRG